MMPNSYIHPSLPLAAQAASAGAWCCCLSLNVFHSTSGQWLTETAAAQQCSRIYKHAAVPIASLFSHLHISRAAMNGEQARPSILQHLGILYCRLQLRKQPDLDRNRRFEPRRCCTDQLLHQWLVIHEECTVVATLGDALWATQVQINIVCLIL